MCITCKSIKRNNHLYWNLVGYWDYDLFWRGQIEFGNLVPWDKKKGPQKVRAGFPPFGFVVTKLEQPIKKDVHILATGRAVVDVVVVELHVEVGGLQSL